MLSVPGWYRAEHGKRTINETAANNSKWLEAAACGQDIKAVEEVGCAGAADETVTGET